jgi:hypothetical protein
MKDIKMLERAISLGSSWTRAPSSILNYLEYSRVRRVFKSVDLKRGAY